MVPLCVLLGTTMTHTKSILSAFAAMLAFSGPAYATQSTTSYNVAPGACSAPIAIPANNLPVTVTSSNVTNFDRATTIMVLARATGYNNKLLSWNGVDSQGLQQGSTNGLDSLMMYIDASGYVSIKSIDTAHIKVCNASNTNAGNALGYLTFSY